MPNAYVIGLGKSGLAAARLLQREGYQVVVSDRGTAASLVSQAEALQADGITVNLGETFTPQAGAADLIVVSPGVPWDVAALEQARQLGIETIGEMELAWRHLQTCPWVGITGTNGKTTTTALIAAIFQTAGYRAPAFGNIGYAACEVAMAEPLPDWAIAELSSYQIEASPSVAPKISLWTTFTPDHLNRHRTLERYYSIKAHLLQQSEHQIFNGDDPYLRQVGLSQAVPVRPDTYWTSVQGKSGLLGPVEQGIYLEEGWVIAQGEPILEAHSLKMPGAHNQQNLLMAVAAAHLAGIPRAAIAQAIAEFPGVPHRLELICTWQGIEFINDSKATNYDAAQVGLAAVASPAILIAGGEAKAGDDTGWIETIGQRAAMVVLMGAAAPAFAQRLQQAGYSNYEVLETLDQAVPRAATLAQQQQAKVVLFSPACASFDQYQNFEQRGDHFRQLCLELAT